jgi:hypothetical protein
MYVVRDHHLAGCDETAYFFGRKSLVLGHFVHLLGGDAFARSFKLSHFGTSKPNFAVGASRFIWLATPFSRPGCAP